MRLLLLISLFVSTAFALQPEPVPDWAKGATIANRLDNPRLAGSLIFSDPTVWKFDKTADDKGCLELAYDRKNYKSPYTPKHRSPIHVALLKGYKLTDFVMDVEVMSTTEIYGHQDACLFFNFESPEKYYYVHLAPAPDANAHNVFIVNDAPRKNLLEPQKKGIEWKKDTWHKLRLARQATTGNTEVYFDDLSKPILKVEDKTFQSGYVGFGSFDDTARFHNVVINTKKPTLGKQPEFFKPLGK